MLAFPVIVLSIIIFFALVINMALRPSSSAKLTVFLMMLSVIGGSMFYGKGYSDVTGDFALSLVRTPFSVIGMFLGKNDLSAIAGSSWVNSLPGVMCFWALHLIAFYSIASAALITIGAEGLRSLRLFLAMRGDLVIIYGVNEESLQLGKECRAGNKSSVVFVAENESDGMVKDIINMGMAVITGTDAVRSDVSRLKMLRVNSRERIEVYALDEEAQKNLIYAIGLRDAFEKMGVSPQITSLTLPGTEEIITPMLQVSEDSYGFGFVNAFDAPELMARAMIRLCPPWEYITFDENAKAEQDFDCIVIGAGDCGQAALRHLIMNGQFVGSRFHAAVFSPNCGREAGYLLTECGEILNQYDIEFRMSDARSKEFYDYLSSRLGSLKYIAVCAGSEQMNAELSDQLMLYLKRMRAEHICVLQGIKSGVRYQEAVGSPLEVKSVYSYEMLSAVQEDRNAILINSAYDRSDRTDWEKWVACDTFSKMSSRASAEFIPALAKASGYCAEEFSEGNWEEKISAEKLDTLGEMEHLRWCAFYYVNGYKAMSEEEFEKRAERYRENVRQEKPADPRISKDAERRIHACLIPYDQLDGLSEREKAVTGRNIDYRQADINNVLMISRILGQEKGGEAE